MITQVNRDVGQSAFQEGIHVLINLQFVRVFFVFVFFVRKLFFFHSE